MVPCTPEIHLFLKHLLYQRIVFLDRSIKAKYATIVIEILGQHFRRTIELERFEGVHFRHSRGWWEMTGLRLRRRRFVELGECWVKSSWPEPLSSPDATTTLKRRCHGN